MTAKDSEAPIDEVAVVLAVEDNENVGTFPTEALIELRYRTMWAPDAKRRAAALNEAKEEFDFVFFDAVMPGMIGIDFAQEIRRRLLNLSVILASY